MTGRVFNDWRLWVLMCNHLAGQYCEIDGNYPHGATAYKKEGDQWVAVGHWSGVKRQGRIL